MNLSKKENNSISFWRIVFTLLIVMLHCGYTQGGYIGVEFFFLVSGFLLAKSYYGNGQTSIKLYVKKRFQRLYPMYLTAIVIFVTLLSTLDFYSQEFSLRLFFVNIIEKIASNWKSVFMLQLFGDGAIVINSPAWYVAALFWVSFIYYILIKILPKKVLNVFVAITSVIVLLYCFIFIGHLDLWEEKTFFISQGVFRAYAEIGIGILLYNIKGRAVDKKFKINEKVAFIVEIIGYTTIIVATIFTKHSRIDYLLLLIMAVCVFLSFSKHSSFFFQNKVVNTISGYTYGVYMNHSIFVFLLMAFAVPFDIPYQFVKLLWVLFAAIVCGVLSESLIRTISKKLKDIDKKSVYSGIFTLVASFIWIYSLKDIKGSLLTYIIIAIVSVVMCVRTPSKKEKTSVRIVIVLMSLLLSGLIVLGNYYVFENYSGIRTYTAIILMLVTGFFVFYFIFRFGYVQLKDFTFKTKKEYKVSSGIVCIFASVIFILINILILVLCKYPADYFYDSLWQLGEIRTGNYTNHHSIYHTWIIALFYKLGYATGIGLAKALFAYTIFQIVIVGLVVGYFIKALYDMKSPMVLIILCYLFMLLNPISLKYAIFLDKDQLYVYMALLFLIALSRIILGIDGSKKRDWVYMVIGGMGFGLFRGNGFVILLVTMVAAIIMKSEVRKKLIIVFACLSVVVFALNTPIRIAAGVKSSEFSESLSIPIQQVSRVVYDGCELTDEERNKVFTLVEEDIIKEKYKPNISDNMKGIIQIHRRDDYFKENINDYIKLYVDLGMRYPTEYIKAWVDQTYGYYTPGYGETSLEFLPIDPNNNVWLDIIFEVEQERAVYAPGLVDLLNNYAKLFENNDILFQFLEIGGLVYFTLYLFVIKIWKRNKTFFIEMAGLVTVATLVIATPLSESIRYTYLIFLTIYLSIATTFYKRDNTDNR